jgi:hypothetical protein
VFFLTGFRPGLGQRRRRLLALPAALGVRPRRRRLDDVRLVAGAVVLLVVGLLLAGSSPELAAAIASDPVGAIAMTLPMWFLVPFALVAVLGPGGRRGAGHLLVRAGPARGGPAGAAPSAAAIDGVLMIAGTVYVVFIAHDFLGEFIGFLITLGVPVAAWCGVILADVLLRRSDYDNNDLYRPAGRYGDVRVGPIVLIVVATVLGWGLVTNSSAEWLLAGLPARTLGRPVVRAPGRARTSGAVLLPFVDALSP